MCNKLLAFIREQAMVQPGEKVVCAVSGGADSMAMLWAMWLVRDKLQITVEAAHFNHNLQICSRVDVANNVECLDNTLVLLLEEVCEDVLCLNILPQSSCCSWQIQLRSEKFFSFRRRHFHDFSIFVYHNLFC